MKKIFTITALAAAMIAAATSCQKEQFAGQNDNPQIQGEGLVFYASLEDGATKTTIGEGNKISWEATDTISINGVKYVPTIDPGNSASATFTKASNETKAEPTAPFKAYYPASIYDGTTATLPATQVYKADGNIAGILPMYAKSESMDLNFKNLCGLMKFTLKGTETVRYITVSDTSKAICGEFNVADDAAVLTTDTGRFLSLDCGEGGVALDASTGKDFYVALPAGSYEHLAIEYTTTGGANVCRMKASTTATIERNKVYAFDQTPVFSAADYLCFTCTGGNVAIGMTKKNSKTKNAPDISLLYYTDRTGWQDFKIGVGNGSDSTSIALASGEKVYFRAKAANDSLAVSSSVYNYFTTTTTDNGKVDVSGNIMTLLNGDNPGTTLAHTYTFTSIFKGCTSIQNASGLSLPATSLVRHCYAHMFSGCTALETAPALPATSLAYSCYINMLFGCTALETAPALPATSLADFCYSEMFNGCTTLTTAPALPATSLTNYCYYSMFNGCSKLSSVTMLATDVSAKNCLSNWLKDAGTDESVTSRKVIASTHFPEASKSTLNGSVPTGTYAWTVEYNAIPGLFSVSGDKKVRFSKGNLRYTVASAKWDFYDNQYDFCNTSTYAGHHADTISLFTWGYGTWSTDPYTSEDDETQTYGTDFTDWGCTIGDGNTWRTLSSSEWTYLINTRTNANSLKKTGVSVAGKTNCLIIAPDGYTGTIAASYDAAAWTAAESQGLVCLPAAGYWDKGYDINNVGSCGVYWSSTPFNKGNSKALLFTNSVTPARNAGRPNRYSVRLVSSAQ